MLSIGEHGSVETRSYRVTLEPDAESGGFDVIIPSLPAAFTHGSDVEESLRYAREVVELEIAYLHEHGLPIPASDVNDAHIEHVTIAVPVA